MFGVGFSMQFSQAAATEVGITPLKLNMKTLQGTLGGRGPRRGCREQSPLHTFSAGICSSIHGDLALRSDRHTSSSFSDLLCIPQQSKSTTIINSQQHVI